MKAPTLFTSTLKLKKDLQIRPSQDTASPGARSGPVRLLKELTGPLTLGPYNIGALKGL